MSKLYFYTAKYSDAIRPVVNLRRIRKVAIHDSADAREIGDFKRRLADQGLEIWQWHKRLPRLKFDVYSIQKIGS